VFFRPENFGIMRWCRPQARRRTQVLEPRSLGLECRSPAPECNGKLQFRNHGFQERQEAESLQQSGGMGERLIPAVLKTVVPERVPGVRIPLPPPELHAAEDRLIRHFTPAETGLQRTRSIAIGSRCRFHAPLFF
jgi:hypothetical protein